MFFHRQYAAVAQLDRVFGYEPKGRGFESLQPYQNKKTPFGCLFILGFAALRVAPPLIALKSPGINPGDFKVLPAAKRLYAALAADGDSGTALPRNRF